MAASARSPRFEYLFKMSRQIEGLGRYFAAVFAINLLRRAVPLVIGFSSAYLISSVIAGDASAFDLLAMPIAALVILMAVLAYLDVLVAHEVAYRILGKLRDKAYDKVDELSPAAMEGSHSGDIVSVVVEDVDIFEQFYAHIAAQVIVAVLVPSLALVALGNIHLLLPAVMLPFVAALVCIPVRAAKAADEQGVFLRKAYGSMGASVVDGVQGIKDILSYQWQKSYFDAFSKVSSEYHAIQYRYALRSSDEQRTFSLLASLGGLAVQVSAVVLVAQGAVDVVWLMPVFVLGSSVFAPLKEALALSSNYGLIIGAAKRVFDLLQKKPAVVDSGSLSKEDVFGNRPSKAVKVEFEDVGFAYPAGEDSESKAVLKELNFSVLPGETVALVGASGCGKTTVSRLLQRFWDADSGRVLLNGVDIKELRLSELRDLVAAVPQDTYVFNASVRENLRMANPDATMEQIEDAAEKACVDEFASCLPEGYETLIGERGSRLSGGEKQRLAIAQAFLRDAPIVVLDEISASLDSITERRINAAIERLKQQRTTLIIAHRISTIRSADRIVVMDDGRVAGTGTFDDLLESCSCFRRLVGEASGA